MTVHQDVEAFASAIGKLRSRLENLPLLRCPRMIDIRDEVCRQYGMAPSELLKRRRYRAIARPRQVAMFLSRKLTSRTLPEIGKFFGGVDHTTCLHGVRVIDHLLCRDAELAANVLDIVVRLQLRFELAEGAN